jgi:hypothetical protein
MRLAFAALALLAVSATFDGARADPYRWCAHYSGNGGNGSNCYFVSLEQCRWAVSGVGGSCGLNPSTPARIAQRRRSAAGRDINFRRA